MRILSLPSERDISTHSSARSRSKISICRRRRFFSQKSKESPGGHFNIIHQHSALRADCYLPGKSPLARWELAKRRKLAGPFGDEWFAPPEAVIVNKLLFFREGRSQKHIDDISAMIDAGSVPDRSELLRWVAELGLEHEWDLVAQARYHNELP